MRPVLIRILSNLARAGKLTRFSTVGSMRIETIYRTSTGKLVRLIHRFEIAFDLVKLLASPKFPGGFTLLWTDVWFESQFLRKLLLS